MKTRIIVTLVGALSLASCDMDRAQEAEAPDPEAAALAMLDAGRMRADIEFLADDLLEGREAGTRGYDIAANYVAAQFELMGLAPAGDDGGYFQAVPLTSARVQSDASSATLTLAGEEIALSVPDDLIAFASFDAAEISFSGDLVFVGHGISAPLLDHDDLADVDLTGKVAVILSGAPASFPGDEAAVLGSNGIKADMLQERGAVGVLVLRTPADEEQFSWEQIVRFLGRSRIGLGGSGGLTTASLHLDQTARLLASADTTMDALLEQAAAGQVAGFAIDGSFSLDLTSALEPIASANIAGIIEGSDPVLKDEYMVFAAHLDHTGLRQGGEQGDDLINNGAYDNATGTAVIMEIARAVAAMPVKPRRSLVFVAVTAEEKGLLGSRYFAQNPTVPSENIVANFSLDMPLFLEASDELVAFGVEHSSLEDVIREAAAAEGTTLVPDPIPQFGVFTRSDHYNFVREGIPATLVWSGFTAINPDADGMQAFQDFMGTHYHQPSDDLSRPMDLDAMQRYARISLRAALAVANADGRPTWREGDFFGTIYGRD